MKGFKTFFFNGKRQFTTFAWKQHHACGAGETFQLLFPFFFPFSLSSLWCSRNEVRKERGKTQSLCGKFSCAVVCFQLVKRNV